MSTTSESSAATLDERPPARVAPFPFAELLDAVRQQQIPIGLSDYQSVARLLNRWNGGSITELRGAIAALLATNSDQVAVVLETFDALYLKKPADEARPPATGSRRPRLRPWHAGAAAALILVAILVGRAYLSIPQVPQPPGPGPPTNDEPPRPGLPPPPAPPALPPPPILRDTTLLLLLAAFAGAASGAALWAVRARSVQTTSIRDAWRQLLASMPGPFYYKPSLAPVLSPGMRRAVGDAATILGRRFVESVAGDELDVEESLAKTLKAGMRPVLVFQEPPLPAPIVILRDVGTEMRVWNGKVDAFVDRLEVSGVLVECWYFDEDASFVSRTPYGRVVPLESLAARHDDSALLVISSGAGLPLALERAGGSWLTVLAAWEDRAWLTPINHPLYWRRELRKPGTLPLPVYPMTRSGVVAAARALTGGDITSSVRPSPDIRSVGADDVERMKRLIALVPYPTLELAERLRQRYYPTVPEEVLLFLTAETEGRSSQIIRLDDDEIRRLVAAQRRDAPAQELEVRRFLRYVLDRSEPAAGSASHLRWQLDRAIQQLHLSTLAPGEEARPTASLQRLADSPLGEEVRRAIGLASSAATPGDQKHVQRLEKRKWTMPAQTAEGTRVKVRWAWPGLGEAIVAALVAAIAYAAFVRWSPFAGTIAEHRLDAYALEWIAPTSPGQPGSLIGSRAASETDGSIPPNPDIYRDNTRVGAVTGLATPTSRSVSTIDVDQTGAYYQLRATLPSGNLAVSNAVWVPTARAETTPPPKNPDLPVAVTVDLQPWARVRIVAQAGAAGKYQALPTTPLVTPFTIPLLPGDYVMECENGGLTPPLSLQVSVAVGQNQFISRAMPGFDPRRVVDALLGQAAK